jgi:hypothetical protein
MNDLSHNGRMVVVGRNSKVWKALASSTYFNDITVCAIGHAQLKTFGFQPGDQIWIFAYSRSQDENLSLLKILAEYEFLEITYISSASTNVTNITRCYSYPTIKHHAEVAAKEVCSARVVTIGLIYSDFNELPAGRTAATSLKELAKLMRYSNGAEKKDIRLFDMVERPFRGKVERLIFHLYGKILSSTGRFPCLLRPIDVCLRLFNMRWYGYLYLSNRLWSTMI